MPDLDTPRGVPHADWTDRRVLVTGGAGFLGSHLVDRLRGLGAHVDVLDDLSTGRVANLAQHAADPLVAVHAGSVTDPALVSRLVAGADAVFHLAAVVGVRLALREPKRALAVNVRGTEVVLDAAVARGAPVLLTSSSEVYGDRPDASLAEDDVLSFGATDDLRAGYACSKALGEWHANVRAMVDGLPVVVTRLFNTVGPRQRSAYGMVLPRFVAQARRGAELSIYGDGTQRRCFADVRDVAAWLVALIDAPGARGTTVNVGDDRETSILELAGLVSAAAGVPLRLRHRPFAAALGPHARDVQRRVPRLVRLRSLLGPVRARPLAATVADLVAESRDAEGRRSEGVRVHAG